MIFYFSGTGNSLHAAKAIAAAQGEELVSIASEWAKPGAERLYTLKKGELLGFVFPIYAWGPPRILRDFIGAMTIKGEVPYVFTASTCGGEEGNATRVMRKALAKKGLGLDNAFTLRMPNNYILGYDVDSEESERGALEAAEKKLIEINEALRQRQSGKNLLIRGKSAALKSALVNPLFNRFAMDTGKFYATDACTRCKLCERNCPVHTITVTDKPAWGKACTQCLACINRCPERAIQYGRGTLNKGRYVHPDLRGSARG